MEGFLRYEFGGLIFEGAYTWRGLFLESHSMYSYSDIVHLKRKGMTMILFSMSMTLRLNYLLFQRFKI